MLQEPLEVVIKGLQYVEAFRGFYRVVKSCFGVYLQDEYLESLKEFKRTYMGLDISVTPKVICDRINISSYHGVLFRLTYCSSMSLSSSIW